MPLLFIHYLNRKMLKSIIQLMRPEQWMKNLFVFLPVFFDGKLLADGYWQHTLVAFFSFCFVASAIYCLNDIQDVERDRQHPRKCHRPIASGAISKGGAWMVMVCCLCVSVAIAYVSGLSLLGIIIGYFLLNIAYSLKLKHYAIIDVFIIAVGFVLRVFAGGCAKSIYPTPWLVLMTFLLALFLAFAKRRDDVVIYTKTGEEPRKGINRYNLSFMNEVIGLLSAVTIVSYIMYTLTDAVMQRFHSQYVYLTSFWVLAAIIKYLQITIVDVKSGSPTKVLLKNRFIQMCILGWIASFFFLIYIA